LLIGDQPRRKAGLVFIWTINLAKVDAEIMRRCFVVIVMSALVLAGGLAAGNAVAQTAPLVSPWQWGSSSITSGQCKERADMFLEGKGFVVMKSTSQGKNDAEANAQAVSEEFFVLVDCVTNHRTSISSRILVIVVARNGSAAQNVEQLRGDVMKAVMK
jgi:hypothetical protein